MYSMSSENTFGKVRLNEKVESRVREICQHGSEASAWKPAMVKHGKAPVLSQWQIASAKITLSRMISPQLYRVMSGDEFSLDINNPDDPKVLVVGNNPDRQNIYGAALGLYIPVS